MPISGRRRGEGEREGGNATPSPQTPTAESGEGSGSVTKPHPQGINHRHHTPEVGRMESTATHSDQARYVVINSL